MSYYVFKIAITPLLLNRLSVNTTEEVLCVSKAKKIPSIHTVGFCANDPTITLAPTTRPLRRAALFSNMSTRMRPTIARYRFFRDFSFF